MTKAEEIRSRRMAAIEELKNEAQNAFEWILKLLDAKTAEFEFGPLVVYAYITEEHKVRMEVGGAVYKSGTMNISSAKVLLQSIKEVIDAEDGYSAELCDSTGYHDVERLRVVIK